MMNQVYNLVKVATTKQSKLLRKGFAVFAVLALTMQLVLPAVTVRAADNEEDNVPTETSLAPITNSAVGHVPVGVCHQKGNGGYVYINIDESGLNGHAHHNGDIVIYSDSQSRTCPGETPADSACTDGSVTVVTPGDTKGWSSVAPLAETRANGTVSFVTDATTPAGNGALSLVTGAATGSPLQDKAQYMHATNTPLSQVTDLCYWTKQNSASFVNGAPSYQLVVLLDGSTLGSYTTFVYEPYNDGKTINPGVWQNWDVDESGKLWSSRTVNAGGDCLVTAGSGGAPFYSLENLQEDCPDARVVAFGVNVGSNNPDYDTEVEYVQFNDDVYDFEPGAKPVRAYLEVEKVWQNADGQEVDAPSNASDITITVEYGDDKSTDCTYGEDGILCDKHINIHVGDQVHISESGVPAGWSVETSTVGDITPVCESPNEDESPNEEKVKKDDKKPRVKCTATVVNKQNTPPPCATELVVNGGFEVPNVETGAKWDIFESGTTGLGWSAEWLNNVGGAQPDKGQVELHKNGVVSGWTAHGGDQYTELDSDWGGPSSNQGGENASVKLYQDLITKVGGNYTVTFWASPRPGQSSTDNSIRVKVGDIDSVVNAVTGSSTVWSKYTYTFEATSGVTRLEFSDAGPGNSYGGFLDDVSVKEDCVSDVQICKYNDDQTPLSGWEVYLKGDKVETVTVDPDGQSDLSGPLPAGDYVLEASGTYVYRPSDPSADISDPAFSKRLPSDAVYSIGSSQPWVRVNDFPGAISGYLGIQVGGLNFDWGSTYNPAHKYSGEYTLASAGQMSFRILDDVYSDNSGHLKVDIYPIYKGETGKDGCVTLENIPFSGKGTNYTLGEVMQDGWENVSGNNEEVVVDGVEDSFSLVNKCTGENCVIPCSEFNLGVADGFVASGTVQGLRKNGTPVLAGRSDPNTAVGAPDWVSGTGTNFYSLGFGGKITLSFTGYVNNVSGDDLKIHEATNGVYPEESVSVEVSQDGLNWFALSEEGTNTSPGGITGVDFGSTGLAWIKFVRLTDTSNPADFSQADADGFDVDAIEAVTETCEPPVIEEPCTEISENVTLASDTNTQTAGYTTVNPGDGFGEDPLDPNAYSGSFMNSAIANPVIPPWLDPATHPAYAGSGAQWISSTAQHPGETEGAGSGVDDQWRLFQKKFTVPAGAIVTPGTINFTADNGVTVYLNGHEIGNTPEVPTFGATPSPIPVVFDHSYSVPFTPVAGQENVLEFVVRNSNYSGVNPTGLVYNANYSYRVECDTPPDECNTMEKAYTHTGLGMILDIIKSNKGDEDEDGDYDCYSVSGNVYHDQSDLGTRFNGENPVDTGIAGMLVYIDLNENDAPDTDEPQTESLANGDYQIDGLPAGCYTVREDASSVPGWAQGVQPLDHEYQVGIGGFECNPSDDLLKLSFVKTAQAVALDTFPDDAYGLDFGNLPTDRGGNSGGGNSGGGNSGSSLIPRVLGDSTTTPSETPLVPQVAGATTLPRTGLPTWALLMVALLAVPAFGLKTLVIKKTSK